MFINKRDRKKNTPQTPELVTGMPLTPGAAGMRAAETVIPLGRKGILDIVTPAEEDVLGWCCFARERHSDEWHAVREVSGKYVIPVPDTDIEVLGFHRFGDVAGANEKVWRIYVRNDAGQGIGADICLRLVVRSAACEVVRELPRRVSPLRSRVQANLGPQSSSRERTFVPAVAASYV